MSEPLKIGPLWDRVVVDVNSQTIRRRGRPICRFPEVKQLRLREYINRDEEEQLLNLHPDVQKRHREAELWVDLHGGPSICVTVLGQAGLLLQQSADAARLVGVPLATERTRLDFVPKGQ